MTTETDALKPAGVTPPFLDSTTSSGELHTRSSPAPIPVHLFQATCYSSPSTNQSPNMGPRLTAKPPPVIKRRLIRTDSVTKLSTAHSNTPIKSSQDAMTTAPHDHSRRAPEKGNATRKVTERARLTKQRTMAPAGLSNINSNQSLATSRYDHPQSTNQNLFASCPNLAENEAGSFAKPVVRMSKSSTGRLGDKPSSAPSPASSSTSESPKLLTVPDIFTTSFSHTKAESKKAFTKNSTHCRGRTTGRIYYRHSAPELVDSSSPSEIIHISNLRARSSIARSASATISNPDDHVTSLSAEITPRYDPQTSLILNNLYLGNLDSAYNQRLLCRLGVSSVVDLSNFEPDEVPDYRKNKVPCMCNSQQYHNPAILRLKMSESDISEIKSHFTAINKFIDGARRNNKSVLVICCSGTVLSALIVSQYIIRCEKMRYRKVYSLLMKQRSDIDLNRAYHNLLTELDNELFSGSTLSVSSSDGEEQPVLEGHELFPREAWTDI